MSRYLYSAKLAPIGKPVVVGIPGEGQRRIRLDDCALPLAHRAKVRVDHGGEDLGQFSVVIRHKGWWIGDFVLDPDAVTAETEDLIRPGQPLSIGLAVMRSRIEPDGVEYVLQADLEEVSICRAGMIEGAKITSKHALRQVQRQAAASAAPASRVVAPAVPGDHPWPVGQVITHPAGTIVRRNCGVLLAVTVDGVRTEFAR